MSQAQNQLIEQMARRVAELEAENRRLREGLATRATYHRTCEVCGATSDDTWIFWVGKRWLCGPHACAAPASAA